MRVPPCALAHDGPHPADGHCSVVWNGKKWEDLFDIFGLTLACDDVSYADDGRRHHEERRALARGPDQEREDEGAPDVMEHPRMPYYQSITDTLTRNRLYFSTRVNTERYQNSLLLIFE